MEAGDMTSFNIQHGFVEALQRGYRSGFLSDLDYHHLCQCESLEDMKMNLQETDYDQFLSNESRQLAPSIIQEKALNKLVTEFNFLRAQAAEPLGQFMEFIKYEFMIENIMILLKGTLSGRDINELIEQCHPLGMFKDSTMRSIPTFEANAKGYADLYQTVLIDTPVGPYFSEYLANTGDAFREASEVRHVLEEHDIDIIKNSLMKLYLEDFYNFCVSVGGDTAEIMGDLLKARADRHAINITLNSFGTPLNEPSLRRTDRFRLYPSVGFLYPEGTGALLDVENEAGLGRALLAYPPYHQLWTAHQNDALEEKTIDDAFDERDVQMLELAFEGQMHFAPFYAYVKLKEQEIRNLVWISECIIQGQKEEIHKFVPCFSENSPWRAKNGGR